MTFKTKFGQIIPETALDSINKPLHLLAGFAIENILKALIIFENPSYVSGGRLARCLLSHNLTALSEQANADKIHQYLGRICLILESGLTTWARYPSEASVKDIKSAERDMNDLDWLLYKDAFKSLNAELDRN